MDRRQDGGGSQVLVVGGGPAGATLAIRLAQLGGDVCLLERDAYPRRKIGESLPPSICPVLDQIGVRGRVEEVGFSRPGGAIVRWAGRGDVVIQQDGLRGFQVDRGTFDTIVLDAARRNKVRVLQPAEFLSAQRLSKGGWRVEIKSQNGRLEWRAGFLVWAAGRGRGPGGRIKRVSVPTLALYGYWRGASFDGSESRVEAANTCWYWGAPLPDGTVNAAVFIDPDSPALRSGCSMTKTYIDLIRQSELLSPCTSGTMVTATAACHASRHITSPAVGRDFIRIGEASFTVDPLSSQGVVHAMVSAIQGAIIINTILHRPENADAAMEFCMARQHEVVERDRIISRAYYCAQAEATPTTFWTKRARDAVPEPRLPASVDRRQITHHTSLRIAQDAVVDQVPILDHQYIERCPALMHPCLNRPLAFYKGVPITKLLEPLEQRIEARDLLDTWQGYLPERDAIWLLSLLWERSVLVHSR